MVGIFTKAHCFLRHLLGFRLILPLAPTLVLALALILIFLSACEEPPPEEPPTDIPKDEATKEPLPDDTGPFIQLEKTDFVKLQGWQTSNEANKADNMEGILLAFSQSCDYFTARGNGALTAKIPNQQGTLLSATDYRKPCALMPPQSEGESAAIRLFFESHFTPYLVHEGRYEQGKLLLDRHGLFTGYYEAELEASLQKTPPYIHPIWGVPDDLIRIDLGDFDPDLSGHRLVGRIENNEMIPYYNRGHFERETKSPNPPQGQPLLWAKDALDVFILHIQGSGRAILPDGQVMRLQYAANNGHNYRSIGSALIRRGELRSGQAGWTQIRQWLQDNPNQAQSLLHENPRYIFFALDDNPPQNPLLGPKGSLGRPLTVERSLAVDPSFMPLGAPVWLDTMRPGGDNIKLQRLMMAQDTGNAIKGVVRGDFFWGYGAPALREAGRMKSQGQYYLLLPKDFLPATEILVQAK